MRKKTRLDQLLLDRNLVLTLKQATHLIMIGSVLVNDKKITKQGYQVSSNDKITLLKTFPKYVSRGGEKLEGAIKYFGIDIKDRIALDIGISTGGFADYLLKNSVKFVFGVDVGYGITDNKLRQDPRVFLLERTNARHLTKKSLVESIKNRSDLAEYIENISLVVMDVSFISITKVLPAVQSLVTKDADYVVLVKPQFEAPKELVGDKGIIRDKSVQEQVLVDLEEKLSKEFRLVDKCPSLVVGTKGNQEYFFFLS